MCQAVPTAERTRSVTRVILIAAALASAFGALRPEPAEACGCLSPPIPPPMPGAVNFAVNQQAEQIIFEVEPDGQHIVAHVLIQYAGDPEQFAWIVPVPSVPELELSYAEAFGMIDQQTRPQISISTQSMCPPPLYVCRQHPMPVCGDSMFGSAGTGAFNAASPSSGSFAGSGGSSPPPQAPGVMVYARQQIGSYDTIVFGAGDAQGAVDWLQTEGFIVNDTMSPYMEPYLALDMLFVAAKLVPGADADEIRPLRMRYEGSQPMIPLQLTAVATEPNLTVTAYIYGATSFAPLDQTLLFPSDIPADALGGTPTRNNYPMLLSRLFDEDGGRAFMLEYAGSGPRFQPVPLNQGGGQFFPVAPGISDCCQAGAQTGDPCGILNDGECQCPLSAEEAQDCAESPDLVAGVRLVERLATDYPRLTRITTRMSADEMTFDPMFEADATIAPMRLSLSAVNQTLDACADQILDRERYDALSALQFCSTTYCGRGRCVATDAGVGCVCDTGQVARQFTDLDGAPSLTCVPETAPVDLEAGGLVIPDICDTLSALEDGGCVNLAGFAGIRCNDGTAAALIGSGIAPTCQPIMVDGDDSGARNYTLELEDLRICAPRPPACDARFGWLEETEYEQRPSVERCDSSIAHSSWLEMPPVPTCITTSATISTPSVSTVPRPQTTTPSRAIQEDTTIPRSSAGASDSDDGCSVVRAHGGSARLTPFVVLGALLALMGRKRASARAAR